MTSANAKALAVAVPIITHFEGFIAHPYLCPNNVPTIGYGTTFYPNGARVTLRDSVITEVYARNLLIGHIEHDLLPAVLKLCPGADTPERIGALVSFAYNLGVAALAGSTLRKRVNARDWPAARAECMRWVKSGGVTLRGLVRRRQAEAALL